MINQALNLLKENKTGSFKLKNDTVLVVTPNAIAYRYFVKYRKEVQQDLLAAKVGGAIIGNSSALEDYTRHLGDRGVVTAEQLALSELVPMIPFSVLKQANLNLATFREIDRGESETLKRRETRAQLTGNQLEALKKDVNIVDLESKKVEATGWDVSKNEKRFDVVYSRKQHFAGARLFQVDREVQQDGRRVFLLDVDRNELKHGLINPFLVELRDSTVDSIAAAYESLKPTEVIQAESNDIPVHRQGEWFFIPVSELESKRAEKIAEVRIAEVKASGENRFGIKRANRGVLQAGQNRPNSVESMVEIDGKYFVKGTVSHSGREHRDLKLTSWHRAVPNTSQSSWTITGDID